MKNIVFTICLFVLTSSFFYAQRTDNKEASVLLLKKLDKKPLVFVDGKKFDFPVEIIDPTTIASMHVLKGKEALKQYNAPNGVILIQTKSAKRFNFTDIKTVEKGFVLEDKNTPMIIIDGKKSNQKELKKLTPDKIDKIEVLKGEKALEKHNASNGVVIITTKKAN